MSRSILLAGCVCLGLGLVSPTAGEVPEAAIVRVNGNPLGAEVDLAEVAWFGEAVAGAEVVHLAGDCEEDAELLHQVRLRLIRALHEQGGFEVLVLPVGIFEGAWTDWQLAKGDDVAGAATPLYRVWRESAAFLRILEYVKSTRDSAVPIELIGGLCRFHAAGKALYGPHLKDLFDRVAPDLLGESLRERIDLHWAGTQRLSRATGEERDAAAALARELLARFDVVRPELEEAHGGSRVELERQILVNMDTFVELERIRGGDTTDDGSFELHEKGQNLSWLLERHAADRKIIYWGGRGATVALPTEASVVRLDLTCGDSSG